MYPLDAVYDTAEDVPEDVKTNKRYAGLSGFTIQEVADQIKADYGQVQSLPLFVAECSSTNMFSPCFEGFAYLLHFAIIHLGPFTIEVVSIPTETQVQTGGSLRSPVANGEYGSYYHVRREASPSPLPRCTMLYDKNLYRSRRLLGYLLFPKKGANLKLVRSETPFPPPPCPPPLENARGR